MTRNNLLLQALSLIVAAVVLGLAVVIGALVVGVLLAVGAIAAIAFAARIWWLQRKSRAAADRSAGSARPLIDADYTVVGESDPKDSHPRLAADARGRPRDSAD